MGARTTVSTGLPLASTVPPSCSASRSCASDSCERASSTCRCAVSRSAGGVRVFLRSSCLRGGPRPPVFWSLPPPPPLGGDPERERGGWGGKGEIGGGRFI